MVRPVHRHLIMEQLVITVLYQAQILLLSLHLVAVAVVHVDRMEILEVLAEEAVVRHRNSLVVLVQLIKVMLEDQHKVEVVLEAKETVVLELVVLVVLVLIHLIKKQVVLVVLV